MAETDQDMCVSIEELEKQMARVGPVVRFSEASARQGGHEAFVGHGWHDLGHAGMDHIAGAGKGGTGSLDTNKMVERDGVGGIKSRGLHMVDGTDLTAELDGYWEGSQFVQVCNDFEFEGIGLCDGFEVDVFDRF